MQLKDAPSLVEKIMGISTSLESYNLASMNRIEIKPIYLPAN